MIKEYFSSRKKTMTSPFDSSSKKKKPHQVDRFIPHSVSKNLYSLFKDIDENKNQSVQNMGYMSKSSKYSNFLSQNLIKNQVPNNQGKVLHFGEQPCYSKQNMNTQNLNIQNINMQNMNIQNIYQAQTKLIKKKIATQPYKILQAPLLKDDFYLNLLDWSDQNYIAVGLTQNLFVWSGCSSKVKKIYQTQNQYQEICAVNFMKHTPKICIGTNQGKVKIFDIHKSTSFSYMDNLHTGRIGSLGCTNNLIVTGSKDGYVSIQDYRTSQQVFRYKAHQQQISGLKICPNNEMIATGGNDNKMLLFSLKRMSCITSWEEHNAAVKAIGFNPNHPSIASGGGTADKKIRIFSLHTFQKLSQIDTGSQVCNLRFSPISNQLVTTHGYSLNQIILWKWDKNLQLTKTDSLMGHKNRVLYLAGQHQGSKIVTGAGDQELRLWKIFDQGQKNSISYDLR